MKKILTFILLFSLLFPCLASCRKTDADGENGVFYSFTDSTGKTVSLPSRPERVAVLFSSYAEIWTLAGGKVSVSVGESVERGFADGDTVLVDESAGHSQIDLEALIASRPDLVIGSADYECQLSACELCAKAGIPSAVFRVESLSDYLRVLRIMCDITGSAAAYERYGASVAANAEKTISSFVTSLGEKEIKILFIRAGSSARSTKAKNAESNFVCAMLDELGTQNIADTSSPLLDNLSLEYIVSEQPDYIFISTMGNENAAREYITELFESDAWRELDAVKRGAYAFLPKDMFHYKPNARWDAAYAYLAKLLETELTREK